MATINDFKKLELKIAKILEVYDHPKADKLYLLKISLGGIQKQLVAGIKEYYKKEDLIGKQIVVIDNLDPATIRGEISEGMLLASRDDEGISLIAPDRETKLGSLVS